MILLGIFEDIPILVILVRIFWTFHILSTPGRQENYRYKLTSRLLLPTINMWAHMTVDQPPALKPENPCTKGWAFMDLLWFLMQQSSALPCPLQVYTAALNDSRFFRQRTSVNIDREQCHLFAIEMVILLQNIRIRMSIDVTNIRSTLDGDIFQALSWLKCAKFGIEPGTGWVWLSSRHLGILTPNFRTYTGPRAHKLYRLAFFFRHSSGKWTIHRGFTYQQMWC